MPFSRSRFLLRKAASLWQDVISCAFYGLILILGDVNCLPISLSVLLLWKTASLRPDSRSITLFAAFDFLLVKTLSLSFSDYLLMRSLVAVENNT